MPTRISEETRTAIAAAWPELLAGFAAGDLVRDVIERAGLSVAAVREYRTSTPGAQAEWDAAREQSADALMDEALHIARTRTEIARNPDGTVINGTDGKPLIIPRDSSLARVQADTLKWAARIRNPRLYGDKAQLDVNVRTVDLTRIIEAANQRLAAAQVGRIIDGQVVRAALPAALEDLL